MGLTLQEITLKRTRSQECGKAFLCSSFLALKSNPCYLIKILFKFQNWIGKKRWCFLYFTNKENCLTLLSFRYSRWKHSLFRKYGIPSPFPTPFVGISPKYRRTVRIWWVKNTEWRQLLPRKLPRTLWSLSFLKC